jgi:hypothetical protein
LYMQLQYNKTYCFQGIKDHTILYMQLQYNLLFPYVYLPRACYTSNFFSPSTFCLFFSLCRLFKIHNCSSVFKTNFIFPVRCFLHYIVWKRLPICICT